MSATGPAAGAPRRTIRGWLGDRNRSEIARRAGLDKSTISRLYRGTMKPSAETLFALARVLGIEPGQIILDEAEGNGHAA
ncbi:MAG: helix-turn-helix transcriptional regulator [Vulcanimicrobiaceae bacterium]|jgi:transcriptional regulator with XRE-family HTH domain